MDPSGQAFTNQPTEPPLSKEEALKSLKDQASALRDQIEAIESSIRDLEKK